MDLDPRDLALLVLCMLLACLAFRWWLGQREVQVIQESDYTGLPRAFVRVRLKSDGTSAGTFLADDSGKPLQFVGCRAAQIQSRFRADGRTAQVAVLLDGVKIQRKDSDP